MTPEDLFYQNYSFAWFIISKYFPQYIRDEDICQEAFMGLWKACTTYQEGKAAFTSYASKCIQNQIGTYLRYNTPKVTLVSLESPVASSEDEKVKLKDTIEDPKTYIDDGYIVLRDFLEGLSYTEKQVIQGRLEGLSQQKIADKLGMSRPWCCKVLSDIHNKYRKVGKHE